LQINGKIFIACGKGYKQITGNFKSNSSLGHFLWQCQFHTSFAKIVCASKVYLSASEKTTKKSI
jgi:hypothetical protein